MINPELGDSDQPLEEEFSNDKPLFNAQRPPDSNVMLRKEANCLEIFIPPKGFNIYTTSLILIGITIILMPIIILLTWAAYVSDLPKTIFLLLFSLPFISVPVFVAWMFINTSFTSTRLYINQQEISLSRKFFYFEKSSPPSSKNQDISKLEYIDSYTIISSYSKDPNTVLVLPRIIIRAGQQKYQLDGISKTELDWLASELSNWLGLPVSKAD